jgi:hypothetical protein
MSMAKKPPSYEETVPFEKREMYGGAGVLQTPVTGQAIQAGYVRGYKAALEDNGLDVPPDGEIAATAAGRF